ncbi:unnamed protein product, partial [Mesorhabditis belari]|uniref:Uncharacterized protein n=1 Tax=Mesorhabditis belari TaxID=2138241 RepID=A0AAF3EH67_9BILA
MSLELKIFHSLNCSLCKSPYSKSSNDPKYPSQLWCRKAICGEYQFGFELIPYEFPGFLRDLLNDPSIIESPNGNGWLLSKPITNPLVCSKCDVKSYPKFHSIEGRDNWLQEFLCELPELIEQIPKVKQIRIRSTLDSYWEKTAKIDQELEEKFRAYEESLNKANGIV